MTNWTEFVKKVAKDKNISYKEALKVASPMFKKQNKKGNKKEDSKKESKTSNKKSVKDKPKRNKNIMKNKGGDNYKE